MVSFSRSDDSAIGQWWWTVDRSLLFAFLLMIVFGILMAMAATPMVADRIGIEKFYFLKRHLLYVVPSLAVIFYVSNLNDSNIKKFALVVFCLSILLSVLTLFVGTEIKGARRWISILGFSIQPSEFAKPALAVLTAWLFAERRNFPEFRGKGLAAFALIIFDCILVLEPDIGMAVVTTAIWFGQLFINGLPIIFVIAAIIAGVGGLLFAYLFLPHFTARMDKFLDPSVGDHYQINRSLEAFANGGLFGVGPGEGIVKKHIPDAHADFVFAVLGEEFGFFICTFVVAVIAFIVVYGMLKSLKERDLFKIIASVGLLAQFGLQSFINIASALCIIPTKGMTLSFISYGGSSMIAISVAVGMILALNKKTHNESQEIRII